MVLPTPNGVELLYSESIYYRKLDLRLFTSNIPDFYILRPTI